MKTSINKQKLKYAPVKLVICKINGGELLNFENKYLGEVQDEYRKSGFPHYLPHTTTEVQVNVKNNLQITQTETKQHHFVDLDQENGIAIIGGQFFLYSINYVDFESYLKTFKKAFDIFTKVTEQNYIKSISIRYIDKIDVDEGENIEQFLNDNILSPKHTNSDLEALESRSQHAYKSKDNSLIYLRPTIGLNLTSIPEDLTAILEPLKSLNKTEKLEALYRPNPKLSALIDTDHSLTYAKLVDAKEVDVNGTLDWLHVYSSNIFFDSITKHAVKKWSV